MRSILLVLAVGLAAQVRENRDPKLHCEDTGTDGDGRYRHCEVKEWTVPSSGRVTVDGRANGGIVIRGWTDPQVRIRARIQATAGAEQDARAMANQVQVATSSEIHATGPSTRRGEYWTVSYEIFVPHDTGLDLKAVNGGISISDVRGQIKFHTSNGGVTLSRLGGEVTGETSNGGLSVELAGSRWEGSRMDVRTSNGGVSLRVPENYSADLEASTVNGRVNVDFPVRVTGDLSRSLKVVLGSGGPLIRAVTTNGGVNIRRL
jgi:DUF4097 and DUF4098 domain-containing protein YvlB